MRRERFDNEVRVLEFLHKKGCEFVPRLLGSDEDELKIITTNVGTIVDRMSTEKQAKLFSELESYGVRHDDAAIRNVTYNPRLGRFCIIDFEFATILEPGYPASPKITSHPNMDTFHDAE